MAEGGNISQLIRIFDPFHVNRVPVQNQRHQVSKTHDIELLLVGVTGHGKSATGNSILGMDQFDSEGGLDSMTKEYHMGHTQINDMSVKVADIPGFADIDETSPEDRQQLVVKALSRALHKSPKGFHAVVLVIAYSRRVTREEEENLYQACCQLNKDAFKTFGVIVLTHGDMFERHNRGRNTSPLTWLETNYPTLLDMCDQRCILFENLTKDEEKSHSQVQQLFSYIDGMDNEDKRFIPISTGSKDVYNRVLRKSDVPEKVEEKQKNRGRQVKKVLDLELLLMGVTGHGKSATGNAILGREQFLSRGGWTSVTKDYHVGHHTLANGQTIKIVDIPGFADTDEESLEDKRQLPIKALSRALLKFPNGFHAVLLVISYANRLTKEVQETLDYMYRQFDEEAFQKFGVLVVTNGDAFERDHRGENVSLLTWLENNSPRFLEMCGNRYVLFDNITENIEKKQSQVEQLLSQIGGMDNENKRYMPKLCRFQGGDEEEFEKDREKVSKNEEISDLLGLLKDDMCNNRSEDNLFDDLRQEISFIREKVDSMGAFVDRDHFNVSLQKLEDNMKRHNNEGKDAKKESEIINSMQEDLDKDNQEGSLWDTINYGVTKLYETVTTPAVMEVGKKALEWLGWWQPENKMSES